MKHAKAIAAAAAVSAAALLATGCSGLASITEPFNDAGVAGNINNPAYVGNMPNGFSNWAEKCDPHGFRVFVAFHGNDNRAAIAVVPDKTCK